MHVEETLENYLETIYILKNSLGRIRAIDLSGEMKLSKPTISVALKKFKEQGYIEADEDGYISLNPTGLSIAEKIYERHTVLTKFLMNIGVSENNAKEDACKLEHDMGDETFDAIKKHFNEMKK